MGVRVTFVKVYDNIDDHPGFMVVSTEGLGLWVKSLTFCSRNRTDGHFPERAVSRWHDSDTDAPAQLVDSGRWHQTGHLCQECPQPATGYLYLHGYLEENKSRAAIEELSATRAQAGSRGGRARVANQVANHTESNDKQAASSSNPDTDTEIEDKTPSADASAFEEFWTPYPSKVGKDAARRSFAAALRRTDVATLMAGLAESIQVWRASGYLNPAGKAVGKHYVPHPATWLNQGRWADEVALPDMPAAPPAHRPTVTPNQCDGSACLPGRHEWSDGRNRFSCAGSA